jgi:hypothetical protein
LPSTDDEIHLFEDASSTRSKSKQTSRSTIEQGNPLRSALAKKSKVLQNKSMPSSISNKSKGKKPTVTFDDNTSNVGVFMTMDDIAQLVKSVKESSQSNIDRYDDKNIQCQSIMCIFFKMNMIQQEQYQRTWNINV